MTMIAIKLRLVLINEELREVVVVTELRLVTYVLGLGTEVAVALSTVMSESLMLPEIWALESVLVGSDDLTVCKYLNLLATVVDPEVEIEPLIRLGNWEKFL